MKKLTISVTSIGLAMSMIGMAYADSNWTGFYAGANAGVAFNNVQLRSQQLGFTDWDEKCNTSADAAIFFPGLQLGYAYQFANYFVTGVEANVTFNTNQKTSLNCTCDTDAYVADRFSFKNRMQTSIKGRVGRAVSWNENFLLPYLTAGASFADVGLNYQNESGDYYSNNHTQAGWLIGAGLEWAFWQTWSLRAEYFYANYASTTDLKIPSVYGLDDPNGQARADLSANNVAISLNYWLS